MQRLTKEQRARIEQLAREAGTNAKAAAPRGCGAERRRATPTIRG